MRHIMSQMFRLLMRLIWPALINVLTWLLLSESFGYALQSDIDCLRSIRDSLEDPENYLSTWNFNNGTEGFICNFNGIQCWHDDENRVLNIRLVGMGLRGEFPLGIVGCSSMVGLDLSGNDLRGNIPNNISHLLSFVTTLDLSSNQFSGEIPTDIANCTYLNSLRLDNNQLTGQIPSAIGQLNRLSDFNVTRNRLSGPVPRFVDSTIGVDSYFSNLGLCGAPLPACGTHSRRRAHTFVIYIGAVVGALGLGIGIFLCSRKMSGKKKEKDLGNKWAKNIKGAKRIKLSMFEGSISEMSLADLMKATNYFSEENIMDCGITGTTYRAVLKDGTSLIVKRMQDTQTSEKEFMSEMATLGNIKHHNLVSLLGFCMTKKERLLVYKSMSNGTLHDKLHNENEDAKILDWPLRLKIGIRAAKGFAWLHHSCNPRIIHRNISSKCILLDEDYEPKIYDFGLVRLVMNPSQAHWSSFVNGKFGDFGYMAPECARTLGATLMGDVYSFGVVLLELVTSEKPTCVAKAPERFKGNLVEWILHLSSESTLHHAIDRSLVEEGYEYDGEVLQLLEVACRCVLPSHEERPTMFEVYRLLSGIGQRYGFTSEGDDILVLSEFGNSTDDQLVGVIDDRDVL